MQPMKEALNPDGTPVVQSGPAIVVDEIEFEEVKVELDAEAGDDVDLDADLEGDDEEVEEAEVDEAAPEV